MSQNTTKQAIIDSAINGLPLTGHDVARVTHDRQVVLRHVWPDNTDGRVWDAVSRAFRQLARELAAKWGRSVDVIAAEGVVIAVIDLVRE